MSATLAIAHLSEAVDTLHRHNQRAEAEQTLALVDAAIIQTMRALTVLLEMRRDA